MYSIIKHYFDDDRFLHREDGPAVMYPNGDCSWYYHGQRHREDGPAVITGNYQEWYHHGQLHRIGAPAVIESNGDKHWFQHGKYHREDGPAIERSLGHQEWWLDDKRLEVSSQEEFERMMKLKAFW